MNSEADAKQWTEYYDIFKRYSWLSATIIWNMLDLITRYGSFGLKTTWKK